MKHFSIRESALRWELLKSFSLTTGKSVSGIFFNEFLRLAIVTANALFCLSMGIAFVHQAVSFALWGHAIFIRWLLENWSAINFLWLPEACSTYCFCTISIGTLIKHLSIKVSVLRWDFMLFFSLTIEKLISDIVLRDSQRLALLIVIASFLFVLF